MTLTSHSIPPVWDLSSEYCGYEDEVLINDQKSIKTSILKLRELTATLIPLLDAEEVEEHLETIWEVCEIAQDVEILISNLMVYAMTNQSSNSQDKDAKQLSAQMKKTLADFSQALQPLDNILKRCSDEVFEHIMSNDRVKDGYFIFSYSRRLKDQLLSLKEENLITSLKIDGIQSWGTLYNNLTSSIVCHIKDHEPVGFANALALLSNRNEKTRRDSYTAITEGFTPHLESFAAMINAISGWRIETNVKRSHTRNIHFLDDSLYANRMSRSTLDTMMETVSDYRWLGQKATGLMARVLGKKKLDPWDTLASGPPTTSEHQSERTFDEAIDMIVKAFNCVDPTMGQFVELMVEKNWIEASVKPHKRAGAYCTKFMKSRTPRVYMTYLGSNKDILTLAHELGHAFHNWLMKDMPIRQIKYPMILAETASTFAEATLRDYLVQHASSQEEKLEILWQQNSAASRFLLNLPLRFDFECEFYEKRKDKLFSPDDLNQLMSEKWMKWYGEDHMNQSNPLFWAKKLHFYITSTSFYNYPYTFGYLFSQGVYAQKEKYGSDFFSFYRSILQDTGRMVAEDLVQKHMGMDLSKKEFWIECLNIVEQQVNHFEALCDEVGA